MYWVYVLKSLKDERHYVGHTNDIKRRLEDHNRGKSKSVKNRGPFEIIHTEICSDRFEAKRRERQIKSYKGGEAFKRLVNKISKDPIV